MEFRAKPHRHNARALASMAYHVPDEAGNGGGEPSARAYARDRVGEPLIDQWLGALRNETPRTTEPGSSATSVLPGPP